MFSQFFNKTGYDGSLHLRQLEYESQSEEQRDKSDGSQPRYFQNLFDSKTGLISPTCKNSNLLDKFIG